MSDVTSGGDYRRATQDQETAQEQARPRVVPLGETQGQGQGQGQGLSQGEGRSVGTSSPRNPAADPDGPSVDPVTGGRDTRPTTPGGLPAGAVEDSGGIGAQRGTGAAHGTDDARSAERPSLLPHDESDKLSSRMQHAVAGFVDRPRDAVEEADQVLEDLAARLTEAVNSRRRTLRGSWQLADDKKGDAATTADTEQLRLALRDYRELTDRLLHI
ncbi:hypothetical protein BM536_024030 [Streptomyces phaeoluteigriseus]|uniref:Uncharacterized protein n=1 Tax=Streptomyces phaeoluteigriseus TaxID=114686 RepID=A0A1V6MRJ2_9ACTN|nr:hypothetical protein [Streptomyces phaeoluteigriseus]OQD54916.1 hypothetical protein BM536_024030 [Streptomyces phaeoluteigriseus]